MFLQRWDPRLKFISLMILIFSFSFVQNLLLLPVILLISALLFMLSSLGLSFWLNRIRLPAFFLIFMGLILVLFSGETTLFQLGPLSVRQEGLFAVFVIYARFLSIMTVIIVLFGTSSILSIVKAMRALGLPLIITDMTLFFYRYLFDIGRDLQTMQIAMRMRGFKASKLGNLSYISALAGSLLVRSFEQSDRVYSAMTLRGYGQPAAFNEDFKAQAADFWGLALFILLATIIILLQIYIP
ncbi:MAG: cobalt ECF transporter T component CbiQ [Bacillota bacterium]|nr:cobalt ECF transporter T component CbiQ [Bacillota bacterium]